MSKNDLQFNLMSQSHFIGKSNLEMEEIVLASFVNFPDAYFKVADQLTIREFSDQRTKYIYLAVKELSEVSKIDLATVTDKLIQRKYVEVIEKQMSGHDLVIYLNTICERIESDEHLEEYVNILNGYAKRRELSTLAEEILKSCNNMEDPMDVVNQINDKIIDIQEMGYVDDFDLTKANKRVYESLEPFTDDDIVVKTYIKEIDEQIYCIEPGEMFVLAAAPSMGKTACALTILKNNILNNVPSAYFSLEMQDFQLLNRMYAAEARIELTKLRSRLVSQEERKRLNNIVGVFEDKQFYIDYKSRKLSHIANKIRKLVMRHKVKLIIIDYLQLVTCDIGGKQNREQEIATISRTFKELAAELDVVIMPLSQINRAIHARSNKRPTLGDLRESGAIEQDADIVGFVHRPAYFDISNGPTADVEDAEFILAKGRSSGTGTVDIKYESKFARFISVLDDKTEQPQNWVDLPVNLEFDNEEKVPPQKDSSGDF